MTSDSSRRTFLKSIALGAAAIAAGVEDESAAYAGAEGKLPRARPEEVGIRPAGILAFVNSVEQKVGGLHSFMLLRHGRVAAEGWWHPYAPQHPHMLFSLSKSFTSTGVGLAVADGRLTVDAPVVSFFPNAAPASVSENLAAMRVRHLLTMSTGHDKDATGPTRAAKDGDWVRAFLSLPVEHEPGSKFVYNSAATYMLSAIVQKLTGQRLLDYLKPRLFGPLGIQGETWETCPMGINTGGWGLSVKTEDIARFGQLYLQKGEWNGRRIVPDSWIGDATSKQVSNGMGDTSDWTQGYGYQFWRCRHAIYRGDGAFGQYCIVMPDQDAVLAITSGVGDMQAVLNCVWDHLLPAFEPASISQDADSSRLKKRLSALAVPSPKGRLESRMAPTSTPFRFDANEEKLETASFQFTNRACTLTTHDDQGERKTEITIDGWTNGIALFKDRAGMKVAARGCWTADDTFTITLCYHETPFVETVTCKFSGNELAIDRKANVGFGPTARPTLRGYRA